MAISNHERVGKALDLLKSGLRPYFEREMRAAYRDKWIDDAGNSFRDGRLPRDAKGAVNWDSHALLSVIAGQWNSVFSKKVGKAERNLIEELRNTRNDWAHQKPFSTDDAYRALDSIHRLLKPSPPSRGLKSNAASRNCCVCGSTNRRGWRRENSRSCPPKGSLSADLSRGAR